MVDRMDACVIFLVHVGNNCIRVVAEISSYHGEMKFWNERYL